MLDVLGCKTRVKNKIDNRGEVEEEEESFIEFKSEQIGFSTPGNSRGKRPNGSFKSGKAWAPHGTLSIHSSVLSGTSKAIKINMSSYKILTMHLTIKDASIRVMRGTGNTPSIILMVTSNPATCKLLWQVGFP
ncbi:hypothetical protein KQX54_011845 [Cotesia glomerata]|uniref:Uncharacterized protein n=1 Tax=Cotesia glomerata TaxID=32391 RepID=A0AAV7IN49_COTGL|nr:hypothetical protein KQX54_011845 [Cotesia glomerata]